MFFEMSETGWAIGIRRTDCPELKPEEFNDLVWAAAHCPVAAIKLELNTGETIDANSEFLRCLPADISPLLVAPAILQTMML